MKKEFLFRALGDVGDDLLHMAEYKRFPNQWKKWVSLAACLVLVVSLSILVLPYFPVGCGSSMKEEAPAAAESAAPEAEMEESKAEAPAAVAPAEEEAVEEEAPAEEAPDLEAGVTDGSRSEGMTQLTVRSTVYYLRNDVAIHGEKPGNVGQYIGDVTASDDENLIGCPVYEVMYTTWYSNFAVDGQSVPAEIYVEGPDGWIFGTTSNEKTVSRYTAADVQSAIDNGETQWIIDTFVKPVQAQEVQLLNGRCEDSETLNRLFLASLRMNTGTVIDWVWMQEDLSLLVHPDDVEQRLSRFLDDFTYDATATEAYDPETGLLRFSEEQVYQQANGLYLKRASVEDNWVWLWVGLPESDDLYDEMMYELRFDEDSWRYISIATPG